MAFWSGETLKQRLPKLIKGYDPANVDCASYVLHLGEQAFVTKDGLIDGKPDAVLVQKLNNAVPNNTIIIGTGQFAFLLTEEEVSIPNDAIALISMKSGFKNKGLVNVSGFHVDPGFSGKLIFAVYNAGPKPIPLERKQALFMMVFADLDQSTNLTYKGKSQNQDSIKIDLVQGMMGQVFSPMTLKAQLDEIQENLRKTKAFWNALGVVFSVVLSIILAIAFTDSGKLYAGSFFKNAIDHYIKQATEDIKSIQTDEKQSPTIENSIIINQPTKSLQVQKSKANEPKN